ncbi:uncharacterized protein [Hoplias malabaricus]|uniref:uncharacterized protein n=1 Tax=Hoplias malabaricus TaxID=27720 RepID=UPI0034637C7E
MAPSAETAEHINHSTNNKSVDNKSCDLTDCSNGNSKLIWILLAVGLGLLLLLVCVITFILRKLTKASQTESRERSSNSAVQTCTAEGEFSVTYSTVIFKKEKTSTGEAEDSVTYSTVIPKKKKLSPAAEDDPMIYSSVLYKCMQLYHSFIHCREHPEHTHLDMGRTHQTPHRQSPGSGLNPQPQDSISKPKPGQTIQNEDSVLALQ